MGVMRHVSIVVAAIVVWVLGAAWYTALAETWMAGIGKTREQLMQSGSPAMAYVVSFMRVTLGWDVLFVLEQEDLRRAPDIHHYRLARQLGRTLITLDRDYTDDRRFPPVESPGVIVFSAPDERWLRRLLKDADESLFRSANASARPLEGRKLVWQIGSERP